MNSSEVSKQPRWYDRAIGAFCGAIFGAIGVGIVFAIAQPTMLVAVIIGMIGVSIGALLGIVFPRIVTGFLHLFWLFS